MRTQIFPSMLVVLMGTIDCFTTVLGILFFGAVECNPFLSGMVSTNLPAFIIVKMVSTVFLGLLFIQGDRLITRTQDKTSRTFTWTHRLLKSVYVSIIGFFVIVVINNIIVLTAAA